MKNIYIHKSAEVEKGAVIADGTYIWHQVHIRSKARIGRNCIIGKDVYIDKGVIIGDKVKIQNGCYIYHGVKIENGVFLGPGVILTNDKYPRAINPDGTVKKEIDWKTGKILIKKGASLGAGVVVLPEVTIGQYAMIGAGTVVTKDVPDFGLVMGNPAKLKGYVGKNGRRLERLK